MHKLIIRFLGLNIHFNRLENGELNLPHARRVVIPRFPTPKQWGPVTLPRHEPFLQFEGSAPVGLPCLPPRAGGGYWLRGVTMTIPDHISQEAEGSLPLDPLRCQPHLKHLWPEMELDHHVVMKGKSPAAAYFDFDGGGLDTLPHDRSAASALTLQFATDVAHLQIECWEGGSSLLELRLPQTITIENVGEKDDSDNDIVLNLFIATMPPPEYLPRQSETLNLATTCLRGPTDGDLGVGCSNSQFP